MIHEPFPILYSLFPILFAFFAVHFYLKTSTLHYP